MSTEIWERFEAIEECYEFMLAYAAQGLPSDEGSESGTTGPGILESCGRSTQRTCGELCDGDAGRRPRTRTDSRHSWPCWTAMRAIRWPPWNWCSLSLRSALS